MLMWSYFVERRASTERPSPMVVETPGRVYGEPDRSESSPSTASRMAAFTSITSTRSPVDSAL